ncbi:MAG: dTDP-glucose 4,6-dehydratase [Alphaproteobacteria bacterium]|nr:dTDP-glucose 4,6-dehydratase [Alphaproteobacteria bacterium]
MKVAVSPPYFRFPSRPLLVTGGAGFIGTNFIIEWLKNSAATILNIDRLSYGNRCNVENIMESSKYFFAQCDIGDLEQIKALLAEHRPVAVINFAAETHVDRSIRSPENFVQTNVVGTLRFLEAIQSYFRALPDKEKDVFRFVHVSTDEVYGTLSLQEAPFEETSPFCPNSPYAASKAASDHFVRAFGQTFGLPVITTHCSNNFGPFQFPEKFIPLMIHNALKGKPLPIYGDGEQIRDWLYVTDHCSALCRVLEAGRIGETYNIGGNNELRNVDVVQVLCDILDRRKPLSHGSYRSQIEHVEDRPGHDRRYAVNSKKMLEELNWSAKETFFSGLTKTVDWYLSHWDWMEQITGSSFQEWTDYNYGNRTRAQA